ncbi:hypothetical protein GCM10027566_35640 [Arachidicoccus ginsenosidivorans]|uniref:hypothetical protein n=1 Tax=Arachidicoccus ginsenosidivorans TaxID=496057 RepID=UPI001865204D|nr:hypothetical protein [Arachidicoccus ginsenosidivorans]
MQNQFFFFRTARLAALTGLITLSLSLFSYQIKAQSAQGTSPNLQTGSKTSFQIADPWNAHYDVRADIVMVYGINDAGGHFEQRVKGWREEGYNVQFMTGSAWGQYKDYFLGEYDGKKHFDEGQTMKNGEIIWHGHNVPYIVPTLNYLGYLKTHIKRAIDAGVTAIYLEEPEFWARAGYSPAFKKEWQDYYHFPWQPEDSTAEATYLSSKLKYHLYYRALDTLFSYAKRYSRSEGHEVGCFVPTHSLINYSSWQIVSPEASLASLKNVDGYIAQVWTGTSREPVYYDGVKKERVFENAFLEYGSMVSMTAPTHRKIYLLTDPIEDRRHSWDDYKRNYEATFTAELMYPSVDNYEVMPWPSRIYLGKFQVEGQKEKQPIPPAYATQVQIMVNALQQMPVSENKVSGAEGIAVLLSNSMMFQRFPTHKGYDDPQLSNFYGMAMPLLEQGVPVSTVHMENLGYPATLKNVKVLIMSYANMKPQSPKVHKQLADWVKGGGHLIYLGRDDDPFQSVREWWNMDGLHHKNASEDLFKQMGIVYKKGQTMYRSGKGRVWIVRKDPKELILEKGGGTVLQNLVKAAYAKTKTNKGLQTKNNFILRRGSYIAMAVLADGPTKDPLILKGHFINLYDPELPVLNQLTLQPGSQALLYDLDKEKKSSNKVKVLAVAGRVTDSLWQADKNLFTCLIKGPVETVNAMRIKLPKQPEAKSIVLSTTDGQKVALEEMSWDQASATLFLKFKHQAGGVHLSIQL